MPRPVIFQMDGDARKFHDALSRSITDLTRLKNSMRQTQTGAQQFGNTLKTSVIGHLKDMARAVSLLQTNMLGLQAGFAGFSGVKKAVTDWAGYEQGLMDVKAGTQATAQEMEKLRELIDQLARDTSYSGVEILKTAKALAFMDTTAKSMHQVLPAVITLSLATHAPPEQVADIIKGIMNQFKMGEKDLSRISDTMTSAYLKGFKMEQMQTAFGYAGAMAGQFQMSIEDTTAAMLILKKAGVEASMAGTGLRQLFMDLKAPNPGQIEIMKEFGLSPEALDPAKHSLAEILEILTNAKSGGKNILGLPDKPLSLKDSADQLEKLKNAVTDTNEELLGSAPFWKLFGVRGAPAMVNLLTAQNLDKPELGTGAEYFKNISKSLENKGIAEKTKKIMQEGLAFSIDVASASVDQFFIKIGETLDKTLGLQQVFLKIGAVIEDFTNRLTSMDYGKIIEGAKGFGGEVFSANSLSEAFGIAVNNVFPKFVDMVVTATEIGAYTIAEGIARYMPTSGMAFVGSVSAGFIHVISRGANLFIDLIGGVFSSVVQLFTKIFSELIAKLYDLQATMARGLGFEEKAERFEGEAKTWREYTPDTSDLLAYTKTVQETAKIYSDEANKWAKEKTKEGAQKVGMLLEPEMMAMSEEFKQRKEVAMKRFGAVTNIPIEQRKSTEEIIQEENYKKAQEQKQVEQAAEKAKTQAIIIKEQAKLTAREQEIIKMDEWLKAEQARERGYIAATELAKASAAKQYKGRPLGLFGKDFSKRTLKEREAKQSDFFYAEMMQKNPILAGLAGVGGIVAEQAAQENFIKDLIIREKDQYRYATIQQAKKMGEAGISSSISSLKYSENEMWEKERLQAFELSTQTGKEAHNLERLQSDVRIRNQLREEEKQKIEYLEILEAAKAELEAEKKKKFGGSGPTGNYSDNRVQYNYREPSRLAQVATGGGIRTPRGDRQPSSGGGR